MVIMLEDLIMFLGRSVSMDSPTLLRLWTPTEAPLVRSHTWERADSGLMVVRCNEREEIAALDLLESPDHLPDSGRRNESAVAISWADLVERLGTSGLQDHGVHPRQALAIKFVPIAPRGVVRSEEWICVDEFSVIVDFDKDGRIPSIEFA